jgi:hypothetical protein
MNFTVLDAIKEELGGSELAPVTLFLGNVYAGFGLAAYLGSRKGSLTWKHDHLTADEARTVAHIATTRHGGGLELFVLGLDGASEAAQNVLLKLLEEPPAHCRFILVASVRPLPTIMSRARVIELPVPFGGNLESEEDSSQAVSVVATAVRAALASTRGESAPALDMSLRNWSPEHTVVLRRWAMEAATGRWVAFSPDFGPGVTSPRALRVLEALSVHSVLQSGPRGLEEVTSRTGPAVALATLAKEER